MQIYSCVQYCPVTAEPRGEGHAIEPAEMNADSYFYGKTKVRHGCLFQC